MAKVYPAKHGDDVIVQMTKREYQVLLSLAWSAQHNMDLAGVQEEFDEDLRYFGVVPRETELTDSQRRRTYQHLINTLI